MAHESFEDEGVAALLNQSFISIKVDREERPDIDAVYMSVCQAITGSGGWPLTIVMTPDQKPFFAGTYLPKKSQYGRQGLMELLEEIRRQWIDGRERLLMISQRITDLLQEKQEEQSQAPGIDPQQRQKPHRFPEQERASENPNPILAYKTGDNLDKELLHRAAALFAQNFDHQFGGFGRAPKFPAPHNLLFLLRYSALENHKASREMAEKTLIQMYRGGIFDHIGGGFSRYSTDERWLIPHFEKMLYDNALLVLAYTEAWQMTGRPLYRTIARRTLDYALRELAHPRGGFFCGQDADSEGVEGKYYVFTPKEIKEALGQEKGAFFCHWFGITEEGNFEGQSIPNLLFNPQFERPNGEISLLAKILYGCRLKRSRLHKDDKILASWNGLMIAALSCGARMENDSGWLEAAQKTQSFISRELTDEAGRLYVRWREGERANLGNLDDYAFYAFGLLELYQTCFDVKYLSEAIRVCEQMLEQFYDEKRGGFYLYSYLSEALISRPKEVYDGALPSGNSVAALVLGRLWRLTGDEIWRQAAEKQLSFISAAMKGYPAGHSFGLLAFLEALYPSMELVCATCEADPPEELLELLRRQAVPNLTVLVKTGENQRNLETASAFTGAYPIEEGPPKYYLCENGGCLPPMNFKELKSRLELNPR